MSSREERENRHFLLYEGRMEEITRKFLQQ